MVEAEALGDYTPLAPVEVHLPAYSQPVKEEAANENSFRRPNKLCSNRNVELTRSMSKVGLTWASSSPSYARHDFVKVPAIFLSGAAFLDQVKGVSEGGDAVISRRKRAAS